MSTSRILYAEDDATLAFLTKDNLEQNHYTVSHCEDGKTALETFKKGDFDICILDIMMPKMDGFELATEIRKSNTDIPIIFLSAKTLNAQENANTILHKVYSKVQKAKDYSVDVHVKVDMPFIRIMPVNAKIYYKQKDKFKV